MTEGAKIFVLETDQSAVDSVVRRLQGEGIRCAVAQAAGSDGKEPGSLQPGGAAESLPSTIMRDAPVPIVVEDAGGVIIAWNQAAKGLFGWSASEVVGRMPLHVPQDRSCSYRELRQRAMQSNGLCCREPFRACTKSGAFVDVLIAVSPLTGADGRPGGTISVLLDITNQKKSQAMLRQQDRLESLSRLAGGIAHHLNNLLAPVLMAMPLLKGDVTSRSVRATLDTIETSVQRAASVIRQMMTFAGVSNPNRTPVDLTTFVSDVARLFEETFPKTIQIRVESVPGIWPVLADITQLHKVLVNLCLNARDAMSGGGILTIRLRNVDADHAFARRFPGGRPGRYVEMAVSDTGIGIRAEHMHRIFEPFFTTRKEEGSAGLGLATVMGLVRGHGGFVGVESTPGRGSCFSVYVPAVDEAANVTGSFDGQSSTGNGELIMVIDDDAAVRSVTCRVLEESGYRVLAAGNGLDAVELFAKHCGEVAVVITDMKMPDIDGATIVRKLRALNTCTRIIAASGDSLRLTPRDWRALGIHTALTKPFTAETLLTAIRSVLRAPTMDGGNTPGNSPAIAERDPTIVTA